MISPMLLIALVMMQVALLWTLLECIARAQEHGKQAGSGGVTKGETHVCIDDQLAVAGGLDPGRVADGDCAGCLPAVHESK